MMMVGNDDTLQLDVYGVALVVLNFVLRDA